MISGKIRIHIYGRLFTNRRWIIPGSVFVLMTFGFCFVIHSLYGLLVIDGFPLKWLLYLFVNYGIITLILYSGTIGAGWLMIDFAYTTLSSQKLNEKLVFSTSYFFCFIIVEFKLCSERVVMWRQTHFKGYVAFFNYFSLVWYKAHVW